jgi:hypothetical protein
MDAPQQKLYLACVALVVTGAADLLRTQVGGALAVALYLLAVASVLAGVVLIFSWAKERERALPVKAPRRWFTPWRRGEG